MEVRLSDAVQREVELAIRAKASQSLIVDVYATAQEIQREHDVGGLGLDAIAATVARLAAQCGCAVEFDQPGGRHSG
jgi:hypothetical protein